jgi:hypothetical protein
MTKNKFQLCVWRTLKGSILLFSTWILFFIADYYFISDWKFDLMIKKIERSSKLNYEQQKEDFQNLLEFASDLPDFNEITFRENGNFFCSFSSGIEQYDSIHYDLNWLEEYYKGSFEFLHDSIVSVSLADTIIKTHNWSWQFDGDYQNKRFSNFIDFIDFSSNTLDSLKVLVSKVNCRSISQNTNGNIHLVYYGNSFCGFEYAMTKDSSLLPEYYVRLDTNVYFGSYYLGHCIWKWDWIFF